MVYSAVQTDPEASKQKKLAGFPLANTQQGKSYVSTLRCGSVSMMTASASSHFRGNAFCHLTGRMPELNSPHLFHREKVGHPRLISTLFHSSRGEKGTLELICRVQENASPGGRSVPVPASSRRTTGRGSPDPDEKD